MKYSLRRPIWGVISFILFFSNISFSLASHLRAGEITARKLNGNTYEFILYLYRDVTGVPQSTATFRINDKTPNTLITVSAEPNPVTNGGTQFLVFKTQYTFANSARYTVSFKENFRNNKIININNGESSETPFYIETQVKVDGGVSNTSPQFIYPPLDKGFVGQVYTHTPSAYDPDGDSLSYELVSPQSEIGKAVPNYLLPNFVGSNNGENSFTMDSKTGLITWNKPVQSGLYNIAFRVYEWRFFKNVGYVNLGYTTRDMQITIATTDISNPTLIIPSDTCISAGLELNGLAIATNNPFTRNPVLSAISSVFSFSNPNNASYFIRENSLRNTDSLFFNWKTNCSLIRTQPYQVTFKAENRIDASSSLVVLKVWNIKIIPPKIEDFKVKASGDSVLLSWAPMPCENIETLYILRKDCSKDTSVVYDSCTTGNIYPEGYKLIKTIDYTRDKSNRTFDNNNGIGLKLETQYSYYIYGTYPIPKGGATRASEVVNISLDNEVPIIIGASVLTTSGTNGKVEIKWTKPKHLKAFTPSPYQIKVKRIDELSTLTSEIYTRVSDSLGNAITDTTIIDSTANTFTNRLKYFIEFYSNNRLVSTSDTASTVLLQGIARNQQANLQWSASTPWQGDTTYIYRTSEGDSPFVDTVYGQNGYIDKPLISGKKYAYYVKTKSSLGCNWGLGVSKLPYPLFNNSQIIDIIPTDEVNDTTKPCPPTLYINSGVCDEENKTPNSLYWTPSYSFLCDSNIVGYKLYKEDENRSFTLYLNELISKVSFEGLPNKPVSGCFAVTAVNAKGLESGKSNTVCSDNCYYYELPNVFTPNNDSYNDLFQPKPFPRKIESVKCTIYNRWGSEVFNSSNDININWNGENAPDGLYYYKAEILTEQKEKIVLKGWLQLSR